MKFIKISIKYMRKNIPNDNEILKKLELFTTKTRKYKNDGNDCSSSIDVHQNAETRKHFNLEKENLDLCSSIKMWFSNYRNIRILPFETTDKLIKQDDNFIKDNITYKQFKNIEFVICIWEFHGRRTTQSRYQQWVQSNLSGQCRALARSAR